MESSKKNGSRVLISVFYIILYPWPVQAFMIGFLGYLSRNFVFAFIPLLIYAIELCLGFNLATWYFKKQKETKKTGQMVLFGIIILSLLIYIVSIMYFYVNALPPVIVELFLKK